MDYWKEKEKLVLREKYLKNNENFASLIFFISGQKVKKNKLFSIKGVDPPPISLADASVEYSTVLLT